MKARPGPIPVDEADELRLWKYVKVDDGCWLWAGGLNGGGYGVAHVHAVKAPTMAHRVVYQLLVGPIPDGMTLDHLCRNRSCVRPSHLEPCTQAENVRRAVPFRVKAEPATQCGNGHALTPDNVRKSGRTRCATCARAYWRAYYARNGRPDRRKKTA